MRIWVPGAKGMLGHDVVATLSAAGHEVFGTGREVDITNWSDVSSFSREVKPEWTINCAAYTDVDGAESNQEEAFAVNATGPRLLAQATERDGGWLLHVSTDYVFDGTKEGPYEPDDQPNPLSVYGKSKLEGERAVQQATERHLILRTSWLYGVNGENFVYTMLRAFKRKSEVFVVDDQWGSPTWAAWLAKTIATVVSSPGHSRSERLFHAAGDNSTSWFGLATAVLDLSRELGLLSFGTGALKPIPSGDYPLIARRPQRSALSTRVLARAFSIQTTNWRIQLHGYLQTLTANSARQTDRC
jgi:dTDP-4-dehydrorhamnose reductase